jgi:exodeoxyribonuclease V alpha subunit
LNRGDSYGSDPVTVVGSLLDANVGSVLLIDGEWKSDVKYGRQFIAQKWLSSVLRRLYEKE